MATNKHAIIRYQALDKCFSNPRKKYYIEDLIDACNKALSEFYIQKEDTKNDAEYYVKRRTIFNDINYMMDSTAGYGAPIKRYYEGRRCYYRYEDVNFSIYKKDFSEAELDKLDEALVMLNRFKGAEGFDWVDEFVANFEDKLGRKKNTSPVIGYEKNPYLKGLEHLSDIYNYIVNKQVLKIEYQHFKRGKMVFIMHPYYLKQYNNRWFLFGITERDRSVLTNVPIDRIVKIETVHMAYIPNDKFNFDEYFEDVVGVSVPRSGEPEKVVLKFDKDRYPYVVTKPLHPSQKELDKENCIVQIDVFMNNELDALLFSYGDQLEVLEPESLRLKMMERTIKMMKIYNSAD